MKKAKLKQIIREEIKHVINEAKYEVTFHADPQTAKGWGIEVSIPAGTKVEVKADTPYAAAHRALEKLGNPKLGPHYGINLVADIIRK